MKVHACMLLRRTPIFCGALLSSALIVSIIFVACIVPPLWNLVLCGINLHHGYHGVSMHVVGSAGDLGNMSMRLIGNECMVQFASISCTRRALTQMDLDCIVMTALIMYSTCACRRLRWMSVDAVV